MSSSGEKGKTKQKKAAATPWALLPMTVVQKDASDITAFWFHQFIKYTCTCALKYNSGINFPPGSLSTIDLGTIQYVFTTVPKVCGHPVILLHDFSHSDLVRSNTDFGW